MPTRRNIYAIAKDMLLAVRKFSMAKSRIILSTGSNYTQGLPTFERLVNSGLLIQQGNEYIITIKGETWLKTYKKVVKMLGMSELAQYE